MTCPCTRPAGSLVMPDHGAADPNEPVTRTVARTALTMTVTAAGAAAVQVAVGERDPSSVFLRAAAVATVAELTTRALAHGRRTLSRPDPAHGWVGRSYRRIL